MSLTLRELRPLEDSALLALRAMVGAFLIWGVWDNVSDPRHMDVFVQFLEQHQFPVPEAAARLSVTVQLFCGAAFILGGLTRWAGMLCAVNFVVAIAMVDYKLGIRGSFPAACLVLIGFYLAARGGGRFAIDSWFETSKEANAR